MTQPVILFSGQGAQKVGMTRDWIESSALARELADKADAALGYSLTEIMFNGPEESLTATSKCQPALYLHGLIGLALLKERIPGFQPAAAAGLSLGEFTAHAAAGTFSFIDGLKLVSQRGTFMEEACNATDGAMAALIGGEQQRVAIARAIVNEPAVLFADEPTGNLDSNTSKEIMEILLELANEHGVTLVVVTHDQSLASVGDRTLVIKDGKVG